MRIRNSPRKIEPKKSSKPRHIVNSGPKTLCHYFASIWLQLRAFGCIWLHLETRDKSTQVIGRKRLKMEAAVGFEPTNTGFANPRLRPLGHAALLISRKRACGGGIIKLFSLPCQSSSCLNPLPFALIPHIKAYALMHD